MTRRLTARATTAVLFALAAIAVAATPASAIEGGCTATLDGIDVETAQSPASAIEVDADANAEYAGLDPAGAQFTHLFIDFPPIPGIQVADEETPDQTYGGTVKVKDYATYGVGLYKVRGETANCSGFAWVKVTGKSPFTTAAGLAALALIVVGTLSNARALLKARGGGGAGALGPLLRGFGRAAPVGLGAMILAQQAGVLPANGVTLVAWIVLAGSGFGLLRVATSGSAAPPPVAA